MNPFLLVIVVVIILAALAAFVGKITWNRFFEIVIVILVIGILAYILFTTLGGSSAGG